VDGLTAEYPTTRLDMWIQRGKKDHILKMTNGYAVHCISADTFLKVYPYPL